MKLHEIQKELKAPKGNYNAFGKYKYRSCEDILEAAKPLLGESTLVLNDDVVQIGDRYYIKATACFYDGEKTTTTTAYAREADLKKGMDEAQITGSTSSYARKYALNGLFLIDDTKDADTQDNTKEGQFGEKHLDQINKIETIEELKKYYEKNKGLGKEFAKAITARKTELEAESAGSKTGDGSVEEDKSGTNDSK